MVIDAAADDDLLEVHRLLERHKLPIAGADAHVQTMLVARDGTHTVGTAALDLYDDAALLRRRCSRLSSSRAPVRHPRS